MIARYKGQGQAPIHHCIIYSAQCLIMYIVLQCVLSYNVLQCAMPHNAVQPHQAYGNKHAQGTRRSGPSSTYWRSKPRKMYAPNDPPVQLLTGACHIRWFLSLQRASSSYITFATAASAAVSARRM